MNNEYVYRLESARSVKNKAGWARYQTGDGGRTATIISVNHDEALVIEWAVKRYIEYVENLINEADNREEAEAALAMMKGE